MAQFVLNTILNSTRFCLVPAYLVFHLTLMVDNLKIKREGGKKLRDREARLGIGIGEQGNT